VYIKELKKKLFCFNSFRATTIQYFDVLTSSYINLGPAETMEEVTTDDVTGANDSAEFNISKMTAEKIRQVK
jgi:hypothetical protein